MYRLYKGGNWVAKDRDFGHAGILKGQRDRFVEIDMPEDSIQTTFRFERKADVTVYTDGSKTNEGTGAGIYSMELDCNISIPLGEHTTVFQSGGLKSRKTYGRFL